MKISYNNTESLTPKTLCFPQLRTSKWIFWINTCMLLGSAYKLKFICHIGEWDQVNISTYLRSSSQRRLKTVENVWPKQSSQTDLTPLWVYQTIEGWCYGHIVGVFYWPRYSPLTSPVAFCWTHESGRSPKFSNKFIFLVLA